MNLYEEEPIKDESTKRTKTIVKILIVSIILLFITSVAIICYIMYLKNLELKVYIDGEKIKISSDIFIIDGENVQISIKDFATLVGYDANNGEYKNPYSEDTNKCYLNNNFETASFILDSDEIYKVVTEGVQSADYDYENYTIDAPVKLINNKLYTTQEGISIGCNLAFSYSVENNTIRIYTLPYLTKYYSGLIEDTALLENSALYKNKKALLYDMIIVKNASGYYGVKNLDNKVIIGEKYKSLEFVESSQEFIVRTDNDKYGIITKDAITKIEPAYDTIRQINKESGLYIVSNNRQYGVVDQNGNIIVHLEYQKIGVNQSQFPADEIENQYLLYEKCIPVQRSNKWGVLDLRGNVILPLEYDSLGCLKNTSSDISAKALLVIPEYEAFVTCKNNLYGLYNTSGKELIPTLVTDMYSITTLGKKDYFLTYQNRKMNVIEYLTDTLGIYPVSSLKEEAESNQDEKNNQEETNTIVNEENNNIQSNEIDINNNEINLNQTNTMTQQNTITNEQENF